MAVQSACIPGAPASCRMACPWAALGVVSVPRGPVARANSTTAASETAVMAAELSTPATAYPHLCRASATPHARIQTLDAIRTLLLLLDLTILCHAQTLTRRVSDMPPINLLAALRPGARPEPDGTVPAGGGEDVSERVVRKGPDDLIVRFLHHRYRFCGFCGGQVPVADGAVVAAACKEVVVNRVPGER